MQQYDKQADKNSITCKIYSGIGNLGLRKKAPKDPSDCNLP